MFISGIVKIFVVLFGVIITLTFLLLRVFKRTRKGKLKLAIISLFSTAAIIGIITLVEFQLFPTNKKTDKLLLTAYREAPIGGIWLALYNDSTWEIGFSSREITENGTYILRSDTLTLFATEGTAVVGQTTKTSFVIESDRLIEVENSGIKALEIKINKIKRDITPN
jgi:hypothetical protein